MLAFIRLFFQICFLKQGPQELPSSKLLLRASLVLYFFISLGVSLLNQPVNGALITAILDTLLLIALANVALMLAQKMDRRTQTLSALAGCGSLLGVIYWPIAAITFPEGFANSSPSPFAGLLLLSLGLWNVVIIGHILRHALSVTLLTGMGISLLYMYITLRIINAIVFTTAG